MVTELVVEAGLEIAPACPHSDPGYRQLVAPTSTFLLVRVKR